MLAGCFELPDHAHVRLQLTARSIEQRLEPGSAPHGAAVTLWSYFLHQRRQSFGLNLRRLLRDAPQPRKESALVRGPQQVLELALDERERRHGAAVLPDSSISWRSRLNVTSSEPRSASHSTFASGNTASISSVSNRMRVAAPSFSSTLSSWNSSAGCVTPASQRSKN